PSVTKKRRSQLEIEERRESLKGRPDGRPFREEFCRKFATLLRCVGPAPQESVFFYFFLLNDGTAAAGCRVGADRCLLDAVLCFLAGGEGDWPDLGHDRFVRRLGGGNRAVMGRRVRDDVVLIRQGNTRRADD